MGTLATQSRAAGPIGAPNRVSIRWASPTKEPRHASTPIGRPADLGCMPADTRRGLRPCDARNAPPPKSFPRPHLASSRPLSPHLGRREALRPGLIHSCPGLGSSAPGGAMGVVGHIRELGLRGRGGDPGQPVSTRPHRIVEGPRPKHSVHGDCPRLCALWPDPGWSDPCLRHRRVVEPRRERSPGTMNGALRGLGRDVGQHRGDCR